MSTKPFSWSAFERVPIVGIIRDLTSEQIQRVVPLYIESGLTTLEISLTTTDALDRIRDIRAAFDGKLNIGAGTVCDEKDLERSLAAGAQFIVTPILDIEVVKRCRSASVPVFPGAFTPTEIYQAWKAGASMVKVFPASLGPQYIKDVKAPLRQLKLLPTGGVSLDNLAAFMDAGADGVGVASQLFDKQYIQRNDEKALLENFRQYARFFHQRKR